jgi:hypothetical protein
MSEEDNYFAMPAGDDFAQPVENEGEAPIILGGPPEDDAAFVGDVDQVGEEPQFEDNAVFLMPSGSGDYMGGEEMPAPESSALTTTPSAMQKWNEEWQETLKVRKEEENTRKAELVEQARIDLENFRAEREQKREARMAANRTEEQEKLEAIEADLENDNSWQRVCKLVDMSHDNKTAAEGVKRMRDVMILLKNEPARATSLV